MRKIVIKVISIFFLFIAISMLFSIVLALIKKQPVFIDVLTLVNGWAGYLMLRFRNIGRKIAVVTSILMAVAGLLFIGLLPFGGPGQYGMKILSRAISPTMPHILSFGLSLFIIFGAITIFLMQKETKKLFSR